MQIVENSPARLVMRDRTLWISWVCFAVTAAIVAVYATHPGRPVELVPGLIFLLFGIGFLRATDVTLDKARRACVLRRRDIGRVTRQELAFDAITDILVEPSPGGEDSGGINCRLSFATNVGEVPTSAAYGPSLRRYEAMRETLADVVFAGRARPGPADPAEALVKAGRFVDAVVFLRQRDGLGLTQARARVDEMRKRFDV